MRPILLFVLLAAPLAFAKPSDKCSKTCEEAMGKVTAGCKKNAKNDKGGNAKERAEEGRVCLDSISTMRAACLKQCAKSEAKENGKR